MLQKLAKPDALLNIVSPQEVQPDDDYISRVGRSKPLLLHRMARTRADPSGGQRVRLRGYTLLVCRAENPWPIRSLRLYRRTKAPVCHGHEPPQDRFTPCAGGLGPCAAWRCACRLPPSHATGRDCCSTPSRIVTGSRSLDCQSGGMDFDGRVLLTLKRGGELRWLVISL